MLTAPELGEYITTNLTRSAFRLEVLDRYDVASDGVDYQRFLDGEREPTWERKQPWLDHLRQERESGILRHRVHVLRTPLTNYLRYECEWGYVYNSIAGEDIRILDVTNSDIPGGLPDYDFWLIDDQYPIRMHYGPGGEFLGASLPSSDEIALYRHARDLAVAESEPFETWWEHHRNERRDFPAA